MNFISLGGWCGPKIALKELGLFDEPSLPFDSVRSSIEGIIDCIEHDFQHFFPDELKKVERNTRWVGFIGKYIGFYHTYHNLLDKTVIESFERKIVRFGEKIKKNNCIFLRALVKGYEDEVNHYKKLQDVIDKKYPGILYIICFIIPDQRVTQYYKHLDNRTFLFTLNNSPNNTTIKNDYKPIFDFIMNENLFTSIPASNEIDIKPMTSNLWLVEGFPAVNFSEPPITL